MTKLMTANEARELTQGSVLSAVSKILEKVAEAAKEGEYHTNIFEFGFAESRLYANDPDEKQQEIMEILVKLDYTVKIKVEEHQFTNIYLRVSWE